MKTEEMHIGWQRAKYVVTDWVMTCIAFSIFNMARYYIVPGLHLEFGLQEYIFQKKLLLECFIVPTALLGVYAISGFYNNPYLKSRLGVFANTLSVAVVDAALIYFLILLNDFGAKSRDYLMILALICLLFGFVYLGRYVVTSALLKRFLNSGNHINVLIIGNSAKSRNTSHHLNDDSIKLPYQVIGYVRVEGETQIADNAKVWQLDRVEDVCRSMDVNQIVISLEHGDDRQVMGYVDRLIGLGLPIKIAPDTLSYVTSSIRLADIMGTPMVDLTSPKMSDFQNNLKRVMDVLVSGLGMLLLSPVYLGVMIAVKRTSHGPAIYSQERIGKRQKPFRIYKFRSMYMDAETNGPQLSKGNDPRITPVGHILRKYRLDELPQLWNVLRGDMSLVGPRPEREYYIRQIIERAPYYSLVFQVRPGLTSWGMVKYGYASNVEEMVARSRYDLIYLNNMSIATDMKIMIYTVRTVLRGEGK